MGSRASLLIWRVCAALFFGAVLALGVTSLSSPAGDLVPARFAQEPAEEPTADNSDSGLRGEAPDADRPVSDDTDGLPRMVGAPQSVGVEVLSDTSSSDDADTTAVEEGSDGAVDVDQTEPASQVVATPKFTG